ncbi:S-adenosyl-L-methionine-dependent methyltransferase [Aspergillus candidus]|uniref:S-adenosyl-L-methionine-dependent methyltransferase n=1 Tax=Aspergillus candidus TaxID=41067 RepID=A0A2I2F006_ASPCN|nr:S-adenosyl-L-methionine-dependent methyltransferase [Aspergillus candidus]PLB33954.1 S-adenosyl-L-methionine-dependent methyltransferase [Aspergillus candidus]
MGLGASHEVVEPVAPDATYLIEQLKQLIKSPEDLSHEPQRSEIQRLTRLASVALETPQESMQRIVFTHLPLVTTRLSHEFGILTTLIDGDDTNPVALADLMEASGLDKSLVSAIMDYHCYHGSAIEPRRGFYAPKKLTHSLLDPKVVTTLTCWHDIVGPAYGSLHRVLTGGPDGTVGSGKKEKTAFQVSHNTTQSFYDWLESRRERHASFYGYMAAVHAVTTKWTDVVHFDEELARGMQETEVVFVDIGGGDGSQCIEAQKVHRLGGRIILQDRAAAVQKADVAREAGVETMVYDFFTEQPVKAARAYFIQFVLLNWADDDCVRILASQAPAMGPGSVLTIVDYVQGHRWEAKGELPEPDLWTPAAALAARACHNAVGRSGADYRVLLERAGLELTEIRVFTNFGQAVIMAKKPMMSRL